MNLAFQPPALTTAYFTGTKKILPRGNPIGSTKELVGKNPTFIPIKTMAWSSPVSLFYVTSLVWYEGQPAYWTNNGWPCFLLVTTNKSQNCDSKIISLVESNFNFTTKTGRRQTYSQRNHYTSVPTQDRMCWWLGLQFWEVVPYPRESAACFSPWPFSGTPSSDETINHGR